MKKSITCRFTDYCYEFYGPNGLYGDFFDNALTYTELRAAVERVKNPPQGCPAFEGDSFDREKVRDLLLSARGKKTEWDISEY